VQVRLCSNIQLFPYSLVAVGEVRSQVYRPGSERQEHPRNGAQANSSPRAFSAYLGHVWGMNQGTSRDNSGCTRAVVIWH
jgi:hypothetical protein